MDEYKNENLGNDNNFEGEDENDYASNNSNTPKSGAQDTFEAAAQEENNGSEKEGASCEGQSGIEAAEACEILGNEEDSKELDEINSAGYVWRSGEDNTYHFRPENMKEYVGSHSYISEGSSDADTKVKGNKKSSKIKKEGSPRAYLFWLVPVLVLLSLAMGVAGGFIVGSLFVVNVEPGPEDVTVIKISKSEAPVEVDVVVDNTSHKALTIAQVAELVADAVVEVRTSSVVTDSFFGNYVVSGAGSGVVIAQTDEHAYIVTNYHVVEGANEIVVTATDGSEYKAEYLDGDAAMDIAMLRIMPDIEFPSITIGSSSVMKVGEEVVAIGNPLGELGGTVTNGIVSALDRHVEIDGTTMVLMQTNAAVNPGNSGGGLFNMAGELIGIVNAKESATGVEGLGFAIPIDRVYDVLVEIIENKYIRGRATLDIEVSYISSSYVAYRQFGVPYTGIYVTKSGISTIEVGDYITSVNDELVRDGAGYAAAISNLEVGDVAVIELYRVSKHGDLEKHTVEVEVKEYVPSGMFD